MTLHQRNGRTATLAIAQRAVFERLASHMFSDSARMPAPSDVDIAGTGLDRVLRARPDLVGSLRAILARPVSTPSHFLDGLRLNEPDSFELLVTSIAAAYYLSPQVRRALQYAGQEALEISRNELPEFIAEDLLDPVIARGRLYRWTDGSRGSNDP
jgi:hypothetical protein